MIFSQWYQRKEKCFFSATSANRLNSLSILISNSFMYGQFAVFLMMSFIFQFVLLLVFKQPYIAPKIYFTDLFQKLYKDKSTHPIIKKGIVLEMLTFQLLSLMIVKETEKIGHDTIITCIEIIHMNFLLLMNLITERISKAHSNKNVCYYDFV